MAGRINQRTETEKLASSFYAIGEAKKSQKERLAFSQDKFCTQRKSVQE